MILCQKQNISASNKVWYLDLSYYVKDLKFLVGEKLYSKQRMCIELYHYSQVNLGVGKEVAVQVQQSSRSRSNTGFYLLRRLAAIMYYSFCRPKHYGA